MSGHRIGADLADGFASKQLSTLDPGTTGTIRPEVSHSVCELVSVGADETRIMADAEGYPVGFQVTLIMKTDGGDITITQAGDADEFTTIADSGTLTFDNTGDWCVMVRGYDHGTTQPGWRIFGDDVAAAWMGIALSA